MDLQTIWFALIGVLFIGYAILDGLISVWRSASLCRTDHERRVHLNAIGPVWDAMKSGSSRAGRAVCRIPVVYATVSADFTSH